MQTVSDLYNSILSRKHKVVTEIELYNADDSDSATPLHVFSNEYEIKGLTTYCSVFADGKPSVGGAVSAEIDLTLLTSVEVPRMAKLKPYVYLTDGTRESERLPKGVFWVDTRKTDVTTGELHIHGYDAMLKAEQYFIDDDANIREMIAARNLHDKAVVIDGFDYRRILSTRIIHHPSIAEMMGIGVNAETVATINKNYIVPFVCSFDYDEQTGEVTNTILKGTTMTCRELLQTIAAAYCGNFIIDEFGELKLVRFPNFETERGVIVTGAGQPITFGGVGIKWG